MYQYIIKQLWKIPIICVTGWITLVILKYASTQQKLHPYLRFHWFSFFQLAIQLSAVGIFQFYFNQFGVGVHLFTCVHSKRLKIRQRAWYITEGKTHDSTVPYKWRITQNYQYHQSASKSPPMPEPSRKVKLSFVVFFLYSAPCNDSNVEKQNVA